MIKKKSKNIQKLLAFLRGKPYLLGFTLITALILILSAVSLHLYFAGFWDYIFDQYSLSIVFGVMPYFMFVAVIMLAARIRFLDNLIGHDKVMRIHGILAIISWLLVFVHIILKFVIFRSISVQSSMGTIAFVIFSIAILITVLFMVKTTLDKLKIWASFKAGLKSKFKIDYSQAKCFHNISAWAFIFLIIHVQLAYSTKMDSALAILMGVSGFIALSTYVFHKLIRVIWRKSQAIKINKINKLSAKIVEIRMDKSSAISKKHRAGQFAFFRFYADKNKAKISTEEHPFTIASNPNSDYLGIIVKNLGDFTGALANLAKGTKVVVDGPYGNFIPDNKHESKNEGYLFIAGGIGITPFLSILASFDEKELLKTTRCTLIWSVKTKKDLIYKEYLENLAEKYKLFTFYPLITADKDKSICQKLDKEFLAKTLNDFKPTLPYLYFCGPVSFLDFTVATLKKLKYPLSKFHYEKFSL